MTPQHYEALPWILIFITVMLVLALLCFIGWNGWSDLREVT